jgi:hypothetical protein
MKKQPAGIKWASKGPVGQNVYLEKTPLHSRGTYYFLFLFRVWGAKMLLHYILFIFLVK